MTVELNPDSLASRFRATQVANLSDAAAVRAAVEDHQAMLLCVLETILERFERDPAYALLDTKMDILSGKDFPDDDELRGKRSVFAWIQGRGLEALAGHARWVAGLESLSPDQRDSLASRIAKALKAVTDRMEQLRAANAGRLSFMMTLQGRPLHLDAQGRVVAKPPRRDAPAGFSDLFHAKGLGAAAALLGDAGRLRTAEERFQRVCGEIRAGRFVTDQEALDPKNPVRPAPGRHSLGPRMIAIGGAALFAELTGSRRYRDVGLEFVEHVLRFHAHLPGAADAPGEDYDVWEFVDDRGLPYREEGGAVRSDPGHATEFAGLSLKFLRVCETAGLWDAADAEKVRTLRERLGRVLVRNFANGFSRSGIGVCKAFDLAARRAINTDMPWWPLPEALRAAAEAWAVAPPEARAQFAEIGRRCSNAFLRHFVRPDRRLMANQTVGADGRPVAVIPATPDADPGYHTGLSLIDALRVWSSPACGCYSRK